MKAPGRAAHGAGALPGSAHQGSAQPGAALSVEGVTVVYGTGASALKAVDDVSLVVRPGQRVAIVGESGSGKSTLAMAMLGLLDDSARLTGGRVVLGGQEMTGRAETDVRRLRGHGIAVVFQDALGSLNPVRTVGGQLTETILLDRGVTLAAAQEKAVRLLREVGVPAPALRLRQYPHELSGGMRQRVMIALALARDPVVLVADEPTSALDVTTQAAVIDLMVRLSAERHMATVLITHDLSVVASFADEVLVMYAGAAVEQGPVDAVFAAPRHPYTRGLLAAVPRITAPRGRRLASIPGTLPGPREREVGCRFYGRCYLSHQREPCRTVRPFLTLPGSPAQSAAACHFAHETTPYPVDGPGDGTGLPAHVSAGDEPLVVDSLVKTFPVRRPGSLRTLRLQAAHNVSFAIRRGESFGLVGESGSGKTTVGRVLAGLTEADAGTLQFVGTRTRLGPGRRPRHRGALHMVFQDPADSLNPLMSVGSVIAEPLELQGTLRPADRRRRVVDLLRRIGLPPEFAARRPTQLSGGQQQRVAIARALATSPALIVCDEAVTSLDMSARGQILNLLTDLRRDLGLSYLYISHDLSVVRHTCDRAAVMYAGRVVELAETDELFARPRHPYTVALLAAVPIPDPVAERQRQRLPLPGEPPDLTAVVGCPFRSRCWKAADVCASVEPPLVELGGGHWSACHFPEPAHAERS